MRNKWYMAGSDGTGEYVVVLSTRLGRVGYRQLEGSYRIRVEPGYTDQSPLARLLTRSLGWMQPGDEGQNRYSIVVPTERLPGELEFAIRALEPRGVEDEVNPLIPAWIQRIVEQAIQSKPVRGPVRHQVFFSYSHKDKKWLEAIQSTLKPAMLGELLWDDTKLAPGDKWKEEIRQSLASAKVAVMLVSKHFLASDFIQKNELPPLLKAEKEEGLTILWVPVGFSMYQDTEISQYHAAHDPSHPLNSLNGAKRDQALVEICKKIKAAYENF
jgi:TIR domain